MFAFILCAVIGILQTALLSIVLKGVLAGNMRKTLAFLVLKFLVYATGFLILYFFFMQSIMYAAAGFIAGVVISFSFVAVKTIKETKKIDNSKGDDVNGHG